MDDWNENRRVWMENPPWIPSMPKCRGKGAGEVPMELLPWGFHPISHRMNPHSPIPAGAPCASPGLLRDLWDCFHDNS